MMQSLIYEFFDMHILIFLKVIMNSRTKKSDSASKSSESKKFAKKLCFRFMWNNLKNQHKYIKFMNSKLQIEIAPFFKDPEFKGKTETQILQILREVPYFRFLSKAGKSIYQLKTQKPAKIKLQYENDDRILLVTGINPTYLDQFIRDFETEKKKSNIIGYHHHQNWSYIQLHSAEAALILKKFLRNKKITFDLEQDPNYRIPKRKVRIVLLNEDFFTILMDFYSEEANAEFNDCFNKKPYLGFTYYPLQFQGKKVKKGDTEEVIFYDDMSEECISKSSQFEHSRLNEIEVEMKSQGIQFEGGKEDNVVSGVEIQTQNDPDNGPDDDKNDKNEMIGIKKQISESETKKQFLKEKNKEKEQEVKQENKNQPVQAILNENQETNLRITMQEKQEKQQILSIENKNATGTKLDGNINDPKNNQKGNSQLAVPEKVREQKYSVDFCEVQENNEIGIQVKQISKTMKQSTKYHLPSPGSSKTNRRYHIQTTTKAVIMSGDSSSLYRNNRRHIVSHHKIETVSSKKSINKSISFSQSSIRKQQGEIFKPSQLKNSPLSKILNKSLDNQDEKKEKEDRGEGEEELEEISERKESEILLEQRQEDNQVNEEQREDEGQAPEDLMQITFAGMKKKEQEYLNKIGRKQLDIPLYLKKPNDRTIFKQKFYEQIILHANSSKKNDNY